MTEIPVVYTYMSNVFCNEVTNHTIPTAAESILHYVPNRLELLSYIA